MSNTEKYLQEHNLSVKDIFPGIHYFGESVIESLCQQALQNNQEIEFFYASPADQQNDKLSYRFTADIIH